MPEPSSETQLAVLTERIARMETALTIQAAEYERRLAELNHAHEEARRVLGTYLSITTYAADMKADRAWKSVIERQMSNWSGRLVAFGVILSAAFALGIALIKTWK